MGIKLVIDKVSERVYFRDESGDIRVFALDEAKPVGESPNRDIIVVEVSPDMLDEADYANFDDEIDEIKENTAGSSRYALLQYVYDIREYFTTDC